MEADVNRSVGSDSGDSSELIYCCVCERETPHVEVDDEFFDIGLECLICHTIWEGESNE